MQHKSTLTLRNVAQPAPREHLEETSTDEQLYSQQLKSQSQEQKLQPQQQEQTLQEEIIYDDRLSPSFKEDSLLESERESIAEATSRKILAAALKSATGRVIPKLSDPYSNEHFGMLDAARFQGDDNPLLAFPSKRKVKTTKLSRFLKLITPLREDGNAPDDSEVNNVLNELFKNRN